MKKVLCLMSNNFEELEAVGVIALLRRAGIVIDVCSLHDHEATGRFDLTISHLLNIDDIHIEAYDALFLPGGPHYAEIEQDDRVRQCIQACMDTGKLVSAICAAPTILGRMGYLKGKKYTCFTSMNEEFGGTYIDAYTAVDGNIITGRSAAAVIDFAFELIAYLEGKKKAEEVKQSIYYYNQ